MRVLNTFRFLKATFRRVLATWLLKIERFDSARDYFLKSLKALPDDVRIHKGLSNSSTGLGQMHYAILRLELAARVAPHDGEVRNMLARLCLDAGRREEAGRHAFKALCLNPDLEEPVLPSLLRERADGGELLTLHHRLRELSVESTQSYGCYGFYQGFERLLLPGQRPVDERLDSYALTNLLNPDMAALDIGCNCGFLSLCIAPHVAEICGIEIDPRMVEVATVTARYLGLDNTRFVVGNFEDFLDENVSAEPRFDLVIATAVHMHVRLQIDEFGRAISGLLRQHGLVLLESQDMRTVDWNFPDKVERFAGSEFEEISRGTTMDENNTPRLHVVLRLKG